MLTPKAKFDKALSILLRHYPFWGSLALNLKVKEVSGLPTMATDGVHLLYGPEYVEKQDLTILVTDQAHKVSHNQFLHPLRRGSRNPELWNVATDFAINGYLKKAGMTLGHDYLYDPKYDGMDAEKIYDLLVQEPDKRPKDANGKDKKGCGGLHDHPGMKSKQNGGGQEQKQKEQKSGKGKKGNGRGKGHAHSEVPCSHKHGPQEETPSPGQTEMKLRTALAQARAFAKAAGNMPGDLDKMVEEILNPRLRWEEIFQQFIERACTEDYTWNVPSRQHQHLGLYLPSMQSDSLSEIVFVIDSSYSITGQWKLVQKIAGELTKATSVMPISKVHVLDVDTRVCSAETYTKDELPVKLNVRGGGGTDFRPAFSWVEEQGIMPKALIYLTDLECSSFPDAPPYPVLWVVYGNRREVPFGEVLSADEERLAA